MGKVFISILLSLLLPGLGQLYTKQRKKGIVLLVAYFLLYYIGVLGTSLPLWLLRIFAAFDAGKKANRMLKSGKEASFLKSGRMIMEAGAAILLMGALTVVPNSLIIKPYVHAKMFPEATEKDMEKAAAKTIEFIENKYGRQAQVESSRYDSEIGQYRFVVSFQDEPNESFPVHYKPQEEKIRDFHMQQIWDKEFNDEIESVVRNEFKNIWHYQSGVYVEEEILDRIDPMDIPTYAELRKEFPDQYDHKFSLYLFEDMNEQNKDEKLEKVKRIMDSIKRLDVDNIQFGISFYEERLLEEKGADIQVGIDHIDYLQYSLKLGTESFDKIETIGDLEAKLRKR